MDKDELVQQIANRRASIVELEVEIENLRGQLAAMAEWRVGDVVETSKAIFKLSRVEIHDSGSVDRWRVEGYRRLQNGQYSIAQTNVYPEKAKWKLIERPK